MHSSPSLTPLKLQHSFHFLSFLSAGWMLIARKTQADSGASLSLSLNQSPQPKNWSPGEQELSFYCIHLLRFQSISFTTPRVILTTHLKNLNLMHLRVTLSPAWGVLSLDFPAFLFLLIFWQIYENMGQSVMLPGFPATFNKLPAHLINNHFFACAYCGCSK